MAHEREKLRILLERWAELEPTECECVAKYAATHEYEVGQNCSHVHDVPTHYTRAVLLASLTEAAEAKGWRCALELRGGMWSAFVGNWHTKTHWGEGRTESAHPEVALLEAYLLVLRSQ